MAQLKDSVVSGNLRVTDTTLTDTLQVTTIKAPTSAGGTTYGPGTSGQVLTSNGTTSYWGAANNHTHLYAGSSSAGGSATSAVKLDTTTAGNSRLPVYFTGGQPAAISVRNNTTKGAIGWASGADDNILLVTTNSIAYWNGAYSGTSSNLTYCNQGAFGTIVTKSISDYTKVTSSTTNGNIKIDGTETTVYTHPAYTDKTSGLYKITVDATGHISATAAVAKTDIPSLDYLPLTGGTISSASFGPLTIESTTAGTGAAMYFKGTIGNIGAIGMKTVQANSGLWRYTADLSTAYQILDTSNFSVTTTGDGNAVTSVTNSGTTITVTKGDSFVLRSGDTMSGDLVVGTSTQSTYPTGSIRIHDIRNCSVTPANGDKSVNFYFHQYSINGTTLWWTIMHMRGWTGSHTSWELAGPANNTDQRTTPLYVRSSNQNSAWGSWRKIYDSSNPPTASDVGALPSSTLYAGSNSAGGAANDVVITHLSEDGSNPLMYPLFTTSTSSTQLYTTPNISFDYVNIHGGGGVGCLSLGNSVNAHGELRLYSDYLAHATLDYNGVNDVTFNLPTKNAGTYTVATTGDIPSTYAGSSSAGGAATNVNITNLAGSAAAATYRMTFVSSNGSQALTTDSINGPRYRHEPGTTSAVGVSQIMLGNDTASGSANNAKGMLCLYSENTGRATLEYASTTVNSTFQLPAKTTTGTYVIATTDVIPTINTRKIDGMDFNPTGSSDLVRYAVCSTAAATAVKEVTINGMTGLWTGAMAIVRFANTNTAAVADLQLKVNSLDAKGIRYRNGNLGDKGYIAANRTYIFIYDGTYWQLMSGDIDTNSNTYDRTSMQTRPYARGVGVFRYSICALDSAQGMESLTTTGDADGSPTTSKAFNTTGKYMYPPVIMYHSKNGAVSAGSVIDNNVLYEQYPSIDLRYSCNVTTSSGFTKYYPLYIECTFDANGYWSPTATGLTQTFTSGKYYILLGCMYNTSIYQLALFAEHPLFYYDGTNLTPIGAPTQRAGWLRFNTLAASKIVFKDKTNTEYPAICDNGSNIWIGAGQTATNHHIGNTYISAGYDNTNSKGYPTIYVSVPNAANTNATNYAVYHKGNLEGESNALGTQLWIKRADATDAAFIVERTDKQDGDTKMKIMFGIGAGGVNHGVYSSWIGQWLINGTTNSCEVYHTLQNPSSETRFAISFGGAFENQNVTAGRKGRFVNNGLKYVTREGSTSQLGYGLIELGNNVASGTAGNKLGELRMYGSGQYYAQLYPGTLTDNRLQTLPNVAGRVMITSTNLHGGTDTSGTYPVLTINATLDYITANFTFYMISFTVDGNNVTQVVPTQTGTYNFSVTYGASSGAMKMVSCYTKLETKDTTTSKITLGYASKMIVISGSSVTTANTPAIDAFSFVKFF